MDIPLTSIALVQIIREDRCSRSEIDTQLLATVETRIENFC